MSRDSQSSVNACWHIDPRTQVFSTRVFTFSDNNYPSFIHVLYKIHEILIPEFCTIQISNLASRTPYCGLMCIEFNWISFSDFAQAFPIVASHKKSVFDQILVKASQSHPKCIFMVCLFFSKTSNILFFLDIHVVMPL